MIDLLFIALFQVVSGAPQTEAPAQAPIEQAATPSTETAADEAAPAAEPEDRGVQCVSVASTGTMMHRRVCTTAEQRRRRGERMLDNMHHRDEVLVRGQTPQ